MSAAAWFSVVGLVVDIAGAFILVRGVLRRDMANLRAMQLLIGQETGRRWARRVALKAALLFGSKDTAVSTPDHVSSYLDLFWGLVLLVLGFIGQLIGQLVGP
jgi:hypothetical protein